MPWIYDFYIEFCFTDNVSFEDYHKMEVDNWNSFNEDKELYEDPEEEFYTSEAEFNRVGQEKKESLKVPSHIQHADGLQGCPMCCDRGCHLCNTVRQPLHTLGRLLQRCRTAILIMAQKALFQPGTRSAVGCLFISLRICVPDSLMTNFIL